MKEKIKDILENFKDLKESYEKNSDELEKIEKRSEELDVELDLNNKSRDLIKKIDQLLKDSKD